MTQVIDPDGDVALLLAPDPLPLRLIVSSKILSLASPVFAAMFSPHFREGRSLSSTCHTEVPLPDDPPTAIEAIANILHVRYSLVLVAGFDFMDIFDLALVADKYDLVLALGPWCQVWLDCLPSPNNGIDDCLGRNIFIRYVFGDRVGFGSLTKQAMLWGDGVWAAEDFEVLPDRITEAVSRARIRALDALIDFAHQLRLEYQAPVVECKARPRVAPRATVCGAATLGSLIREYDKIGIFPTPPRPYLGMSVKPLAAKMSQLSCFVDCENGHDICPVQVRVIVRIEEILESVVGLNIYNFGTKAGWKRVKSTQPEALAEKGLMPCLLSLMAEQSHLAEMQAIKFLNITPGE